MTVLTVFSLDAELFFPVGGLPGCDLEILPNAWILRWVEGAATVVLVVLTPLVFLLLAARGIATSSVEIIRRLSCWEGAPLIAV